jgi:hypothetical protein
MRRKLLVLLAITLCTLAPPTAASVLAPPSLLLNQRVVPWV